MSLELKGFTSYIVFLAVAYIVLQVANLIYKRCPVSKIAVVRKKRKEFNNKYKFYQNGYFFHNPLFEEIKLLDLMPRVCDVNVKRVKTKDDVLVLSFPMTFTYGISICKGLKEIAVEKLLDLEEQEINNLGQKTIQEQVINVVRDATYQQLNFEREFFMEKLNIYIDKALNKLGMRVINVNTRDLVVEENIER